MGNRPLSALTTIEIQKFYNTIKKNGRVKSDKKHGTELADSMVRKVHLMLHEALNMAVKQKLIVNNPTNGTTLSKNNYAPKQILNDEQLDKFMNQIRQDKKWYAIAGGVDAKTLSGILGHANASFTLDNYTHVTTDMQKSAARIVGNFMDEIIGGVENG